MRRAEALWAALPAAVRYPLLASGSGSARLLRIAETLAGAINAASFDPPLEPVLCDLAAHAWETDLFNPKSASLALQLHGQLPFFRPESAAFCRSCAVQSTNFLDTGKSVAAMLERGDTEGAKRVLSAMDAKEPGNPFWLRFAMHLGLLGNELDWYEPWLARPFLPPGFASWFRADYCFARGAWDAALPLYRKAFAATGLTETLARAGECASRLGRREEAAAFWKEAVSRRPWQINLLLRLADCAARTDGPGELPPGKGAIFLYSWNNAAELDATLASLAASDRDGAGVVVLDNGSADATAAVIAAWAGRFGECFRSIALPVNVGAPAARNWLLGDRAAQEADWVVFLDDDARLPRDWLRFFGTSVAAFPRAGVHGCRVVDAASPLRVQSVDLHFEPQVLAGGGACPNDALFLRGGAYRPLRFRPVRVSAPGRFRDRLLPSADAQEP
ncbi:MAG: glycosyltransferase [Deltaproteobacteria bacterium]|nr:glycosyltransferase [Deltaproteobacteria bacterium]